MYYAFAPGTAILEMAAILLRCKCLYCKGNSTSCKAGACSTHFEWQLHILLPLAAMDDRQKHLESSWLILRLAWLQSCKSWRVFGDRSSSSSFTLFLLFVRIALYFIKVEVSPEVSSLCKHFKLLSLSFPFSPCGKDEEKQVTNTIEVSWAGHSSS